MAEEVRDAVFGNLGTIIAFRVGAFDAEFMEPEFLPVFNQTDMVNLPNRNAYIKLMIDGITSKPFSMSTVPPSGVRYPNLEKVIRVSRERYGRPRDVVEEKIARWSGVMFKEKAEDENEMEEVAPAPQPERREKERERRKQPAVKVAKDLPPVKEMADVVLTPEKPKEVITNLAEILKTKEEPKRLKKAYPTTCDRCGKATEVPFEPTPGKEKFCKECYQIVKAERRKQGLTVAAAGAPGEGKSRIVPPPPPVPPTA